MTVNEVAAKVILTAIEREAGARAFYLAMAEKVRNPLVRRRILGLAEDELEHRRTLSSLYWAQTGTEVGDVEENNPGAAGSAEEARSLEDLIRLAMEAEKEARDTYLRMAGAESDPRASAFFEYLADFEQGHYDILSAELERIRARPGWAEERPGD